MITPDIEKFVDIVFTQNTSLQETSVQGNDFNTELSSMGLNTSINFEKTDFEFDEEKSVLDALDTGERKASPVVNLLNTPVIELSPGKEKVLGIFKELFINIGVWDSNIDNFSPDEELDPDDLKIKNKLLGLTLIKSILYLAEIGEIDERFKGWWRKFLNKYVEKLDKIVTFKIQETSLDKKGLYLWVFNKEIKYVGIASANYARTLKNEYGNLKGYQCTINGNVSRCKLNSSVQTALNQGQEVEYWISPMSDPDLEKIYNDNQETLENYIQEKGKKSFTQQSLEVIESCLIYKFDTLKPNGLNGNYSNGKVGNDLKSKGSLEPKNQEMEEINRLQELAGIPKKSQILYRIDPSLEKLGIVDDSEIESGSDEWAELVSLIYQIPFDGDIENFLLQIDRKSQEIDFPISKLEMQLDVRGIEIV
jgi:hypothetical protein